uniref:SPARC like 1 n=1 Tax=Calidris pygmaea TaxID=425635 RepID=A0A8C3KSD2_9CHAR
MKAVALFICLVGSAFAIPTHVLNYKLGIHGQKTPEKVFTEDIHPGAPKAENAGYVDNGDLLVSHKNLKPEVSVPGAERGGEPQTTRKQGRTGSEHQVKNSLKSINFLVLHHKPALASDNQDSDSGSSGREQSSSERYQFRRHEKHSNMANQHVLGNAENPANVLSLYHEHNTWKYNKNTVGLSEKNSESEEEGGVEEEDEEWGKETDYREMKHKGQQTNQGNQYKRQQNENNMQSDEILRDSSQPMQITKRRSEKFKLEEEREDSQKQPYKEKIPLSLKTHNEDQDDKQQSQERKANIQLNYQNDHDTVVKRQDTEDSIVDNDGHDSGDVDEDLRNTWKEAAHEEEERIQSNDQESTSTEHKEEGTTKDDTAVHREAEDYQAVKIKDLIHSEQDDDSHEPPNSDSEQQLETSSSVESMNSMESEDKGGGESHVSIEYNKTYEGICQLFGTKCQLEGTKMGRQLHLDYMGSCKYIPHCTDYEVDQFPLRMRDWLKNILMQYYERDLDTSGFLTEKQRSKVKKIYQNDKRLVAGDHTAELLLHDFEKNYHMYVYPVHWQFHQLDQHPVDRLLTHSELAPLRASLVPMEHCITRFFQECDGDQDKFIALKEWCHCFGIKEEDINENFLF